MSYNNCFLLTGVAIDSKTGKKIKKAMYIKDNLVKTLYKWDPKKNRIIEENLQYYQMDYLTAKSMLDNYIQYGLWRPNDKKQVENGLHTSGDATLRLGIWMENAKWNNLNLLCIDFDKIDGIINETPFFSACRETADFETISQSGGTHCWFGIDREAAGPLFEEINLTTHKHTKSFVCSINLTSDGNDKFDVFCQNGRIIYEYQPWRPERGVSDKTLVLYNLFKEYVSIAEKKEIDFWEDAEGKEITLEGLPEETMLKQMTEKQQLIFKDLKNKDSSCKRNAWFKIGCDIKEVFKEELGGSIWLWWSKQGENFQKAACVNTWGEICRRKTVLKNTYWADLLEENIFEQNFEIKKEIFEEMVSDKLIHDWAKSLNF